MLESCSFACLSLVIMTVIYLRFIFTVLRTFFSKLSKLKKKKKEFQKKKKKKLFMTMYCIKDGFYFNLSLATIHQILILSNLLIETLNQHSNSILWIRPLRKWVQNSNFGFFNSRTFFSLGKVLCLLFCMRKRFVSVHSFNAS